MISMMSNLKYGIVEAAEMAGKICGSSTELVRKRAFSLFTSMAVYSCLDDIDDDFIQSELSSDRGKTSINDSLLHDEDFRLSARTYIRENACFFFKCHISMYVSFNAFPTFVEQHFFFGIYTIVNHLFFALTSLVRLLLFCSLPLLS